MADIVFHPNQGGDRRKQLERYCRRGQVDGWTCKKTAADGDLYVFYFGAPDFAVTALGVVDGQPEVQVNDGEWDWTKKPREWFCEFRPLIALQQPVLKADLTSHSVLQQWWSGMPYKGSSKSIQPKYAKALLGLIQKRNAGQSHLERVLDKYRAIRQEAARAPARHNQTDPRARRPGVANLVKREQPPRRVSHSVERIIRDMPSARGLKEIYGNACQFCGRALRVPLCRGGAYSEVHHLRPLGGGCNGVDDWRNMVVACPSCHAELDLLALGVDPKTLRLHTIDSRDSRHGQTLTLAHKHELAVENLRYHWRLFKRPRP